VRLTLRLAVWSAFPLLVGCGGDGTHDIFVALMRDLGLWRYVEP
jgi:hypothetical protein